MQLLVKNNKAMRKIRQLLNSRTARLPFDLFSLVSVYRLLSFKAILRRFRCMFSEFLVALLLGFGLTSWNLSSKRVFFVVNPKRWIS